MSDIQQRVIKVISEQLGVEQEKVNLNSQLIADLGADSLDNVELIMAIEEEFDVEIPDDVAENIVTVRDVIKLIESSTDAAA